VERERMGLSGQFVGERESGVAPQEGTPWFQAGRLMGDRARHGRWRGRGSAMAVQGALEIGARGRQETGRVNGWWGRGNGVMGGLDAGVVLFVIGGMQGTAPSLSTVW
jgi:hypothetical protein